MINNVQLKVFDLTLKDGVKEKLLAGWNSHLNRAINTTCNVWPEGQADLQPCLHFIFLRRRV